MSYKRNKAHFSFLIFLGLAGFILFPLSVFGQFLEKDTVNVLERYEQVKFTQDLDFYNFQKVDTSIHHFHYYHPIDKPINAFNSLGNTGQPHLYTTFQYETGLRFNYGMNRYVQQYRYTPKDVKYYFSDIPYTVVTYAQGMYREQFFQVEHAQNIKETVNVAVNYRRIPTQGKATRVGLYNRERTNIHNLSVNTWYQHPKQRYNNSFTYIWNKHALEQNGGIAGTTVDATATFLRQNLSTFLAAANREDSDRQFRFRQSFDGGFHTEKAVDDSTKIQVFHPTWRLAHTIAYKDDRYHYNESANDTDFYPNTYFSNAGTNDSLLKYEYENELAFLLTGKNPFKQDTLDKGFRAKVALHHQYVRLETINTSGSSRLLSAKHWQNAWFSARLFNQAQKLFYDINAQVGLLGYQAGGLILDGKVGYDVKVGQVFAHYKTSRQQADYFYQSLFTNHHQWFHDFKDEKVNTLSFSYRHPKNFLNVSVRQHRLKDYVLLDRDQLSTQVEEAINVQQIHLHSSFQFGNWRTENDVTLQRSDNSFIQLPALLLSSSLYHTSRVFNNSMLYELGFLVRYQTDYKAPLYAPALSQFYVNPYNVLTFYPTIDLFLNFKIRQVRFFVRTQHLSQGLFYWNLTSTYANSPNYPMPDRSVKFGISWQFYD